MKIVHLIGSIREFHINLVSAIRALNDDAIIVSYKSSRHSQIAPITPFVLTVTPRLMWLRTPLFQLIRAKATSRKISELIDDRTQVIHAHMLFTDGFVACYLNELRKTPYLVSIRNSDVNYGVIWAIPWLKEMAEKVIHECSSIVFISPSYKDKLIKRMGDEFAELINLKAIVIPNVIDKFWFESRPRSIGKHLNFSEPVVILTVGEISENKNQLAVAEFLSKISGEMNYRFNYVVVGENKSNAYYEKLRSYDFVRTHDKCKKEELLSHYRSSHVFAMTSIHETFGLVYIEALSQGLPIIYTENEGVDGYFDGNKVGLSVDPRSYESFKCALLNVMSNYNSMARQAIIESERFSSRSVSMQYLDLYHAIANATAAFTFGGGNSP